MFMSVNKRAIALLLLVVMALPPGNACGPWFPQQYLEQGGMSLLKTPEFFAEIELKLLAREFPVPFHAIQDEQPRAVMRKRDEEDFAAAIASGKIQPSNPETAKQAHRRMRAVIEQYAELKPAERAALPADVLDDARKQVFPSEFADYHEGVLAYSLGEHGKARAAWERLLGRPETERHYRSVQAAFMIGVLAVVEKWDDGPRWFALARDLAGRGFHDDAGLAAATYRRESQWHSARGELRAAAEDALRCISAGYLTRTCLRPDEKSPEELAKFAADPLLLRIHTSLLLAEVSGAWDKESGKARLAAWFGAIEKANARDFAGAERVAWLCYLAGDYGAASRWLERAPKDDTHTLWLKGKLAAREGRKADALRALSAATRRLARENSPVLEVTDVGAETEPDFRAPLLADYGIVAIGAAEFRSALESFLRADHWVDAAFVAERLMSTAELRRFVESPKATEFQRKEENYEDAHQGCLASLRWLLGRRLARERRFSEARPYFPKEWVPALDRYVQALERGSSKSLLREPRALALWDAALEARYHGMKLFGTETAPDWFVYHGHFKRDDPAPYRLAEKPIRADRYYEHSTVLPLPAILKAGAVERGRLRASAVSPDKRFHYHYRASDIAWRAAKLMPDNDPRLADMLNLAGRWTANRDSDFADRFYQQLERRCAGTELGQRATARRWFVEVSDFVVPHSPAPIAEARDQ